MRIHVNGESRDVDTGATVADLLRQLEVRADRVAVELNLEILDRQEFDRRALSEGDRVEILNFIGGGTPEPAGLVRRLVWRSRPVESGAAADGPPNGA